MLMRNCLYTLTAIITLLSYSALGQEISYEEWQKEAQSNMRLLPEYGNMPKNSSQKKSDEEFIEASLIQDGTHRKASDGCIDRGFKYFVRGDIKTAMYRFNQAWLLDPKNENVYWGFGAVYFHFNDFNQSLKMFDKGLQINPQNSNLLTDKATVYMAMLNNKYDKEILSKAINLFNKAYSIDPKNQNTTYKLSTLYFSINDCINARKYYDICLKAGGEPIAEEYTKALNEHCVNPNSKLNCSRFKTGKFLLKDSISGTTIIERNDLLQIEDIKAKNVKIELRVKWINECTYTLSLNRVINDPEGITKDWPKNSVLTISISDVTSNSYLQTATSNISSQIYTNRVMKIK